MAHLSLPVRTCSRPPEAGPVIIKLKISFISLMFSADFIEKVDQSGGQSFLPCSEVVCPCGLRFSPGASLSSGAGLGSLVG
jgi:hypothetical protein